MTTASRLTRSKLKQTTATMSKSKQIKGLTGNNPLDLLLLDQNADEWKKRKRLQVSRYSSSDSGPVRMQRFEINGIPRTGLYPGSHFIKKVMITYQGSRTFDFMEADRLAGYAVGRRPPGYVWHHFHDYCSLTNMGTLYLMTENDHKPRHHGGVAQYTKVHEGDPAYADHY